MLSTHHLRRHLRTVLITAILGTITSLTASAQFQKSYKDNLSFSMNAEDVQPLIGGSGYIQTGFITYWSGLSQVVLHKTNTNGVRLWTRVLHSSNPDLFLEDKGYALAQTSNFGQLTGFTIVGSTKEASGTNTDVLVIHTNASGTVLWRKAFIKDGDDVAYDIQAIPSDLISDAQDFIITGYMSGGDDAGQRIFLMRLDPFGNLMWCKQYGRIPNSGYEANVGYAVTYLRSSGEYAVAGYANPDGTYRSQVPCVLRMRNNGNLLWGTTYNTPQNGSFAERYGAARGIIENGSGGDLVITGWANSFTTTNHNAIAARLNSTTGVPIWFKTYDCKSASTSSYNDFGFNIRPLGSDFAMAGTTDYVNDAPHVFLTRLRPTGAIAINPRKYLLQSVMDPIFFASPEDASVSMELASAYILSANARTNGFYLIRTNALLSSGGCQETIQMEVDSLTPPRDSLQQTDEGCDTLDLEYGDAELAVATDSCDPDPIDPLFAGSELAGVTFDDGSVRSNDRVGIGNFPMPGVYAVRIYNALGRLVRSETIEIGASDDRIGIGTDGLRSGTYLIQLSHGSSVTSHRINVLR